MSTIDERIVKMQFDNSQFESRVKTTINTLANLKTALNIGTLASSFKSATSTIISQVTSMGHTLERVAASSVSGIKTLSSKVTNLGYTVKNMGTTITNAIPTSALTGMAENVESISSKFSALGTIGITALQNITNKAVDAGEKILSALTIDPLKSGFQEYETQINAVQTILANTESKGTTLEDVNNALDELNKYADQTIYNFTEMTRNIGTFTAAGVDLDTSVTAIKGIANLAAESGSTSQQASTAMYQLSQALASGTVKLQDWNSVVNAGMGGQLFQDALKETARNSGVAIDDLIEKYGSFRETLSSGWLTTDILTETLEHFANDQTAIDAATKVKTFTQLFDTLGEAMQSGWTQTWEILIGDFEEAKEFLTYLSDTFSELINASSDARNNFLESWSELGGRESLIQSAKNIIDAFLNTLNNVKKALSNIIPNVTAEQVYNITEKFREFTENLKTLSEGDFSTFTEGSQIFSKFSDIISQIVKSLRQLANSLKGSVTTAIEQVKKIFEKLISTASKLKTLLSGTFSTAVEQVKKIFEKLTPTVQKLKSLFTGTFSKAIEALSPIVDTAIEEFTKLKDVLGDKLPDIIETLFSVFGSVTDKASEFNDIFLESLGNGLSSLIRKISGFISEFVELGGVSSILEIIGNVAKSAFKIFELFIESLGEAFGGMDTSAKPLYNIVERIRELTENFLNSESAGEKVKKIFKGIFSIGSIVVSVIKQIAEVLTGSFGESVLDAAASIAGLVTQLAQTIKSSNVVKNVLNTVISVMSTVVSVVTSLISIAISEGPRIISVIISIVNAVVKFVNQFAALGGFSEIGQIINNAFSVILKAANSISSAFKEVFPSFGTGANGLCEKISVKSKPQ